jgi:hypothetical protein
MNTLPLDAPSSLRCRITGRLLVLMAGTLSMVVRSFLDKPLRPLMFAPVHFGAVCAYCPQR